MVNKRKKLLLDLWGETAQLLEQRSDIPDVVDEKVTKLFVFSLKDLAKFLLCFDDVEDSIFQKNITEALNRDITSFTREQLYELPNYKISIDWIYRQISILLYLKNLLLFASIGKDKVNSYEVIKLAKGISGPWAHLDLPMEERVFSFGKELETRMRAKQRQRRYRKGFENYNGDGRVGEGHYWRELRNEPFSWYNRNFDDPYPSRYLLSR
jgi:hypothetical protein